MLNFDRLIFTAAAVLSVLQYIPIAGLFLVTNVDEMLEFVCKQLSIRVVG